MHALESQGIPVRAYFPPVHLQPYIREYLGSQRAELPVTESVAGRTMALPFHNNLTEQQVERVVDALRTALGQRFR